MKKLTILFALLCASIMSWAIDWESKEWIGNGSGNAAYTDAMKIDLPSGANVVNLQTPGFSGGNAGIYITVPDAAFTKATFNGAERTIYIQGTGIILPLVAFTDMYTEVVILNDAAVRWTLTVYWKDGAETGGSSGLANPGLSINSAAETLDASTNGTFQIVATQSGDAAITYESSNADVASVSSTGLVTAVGRGTATITIRTAETATYSASSKTLTVTVNGPINWDAVSWLQNSDKYKLVVEPEIGSQFGGIRKDGDNLWVGFPSAAFGEMSIQPNGGEGAFRTFALSTFTQQINQFTIVCDNVTYTFNVYYADGATGPAEIYDVNLALASNGSSATASSGNAALAIDGNEGTRWESLQTDDETWTLDMGQERVFNTIKILWEGAFCKEFALTYSNDGEIWSELYTESNLSQKGWQTIEIEEKVTARYIKYHGTLRATEWGQSFFEFQVLLPNESVLTSINLTASATLNKIGQGIGLTAQAKDQNNTNMEAEMSWEITPIGAGHVTNSVYYPDMPGNATIRAYNGDVYSNVINVFAVSSENLALNNVSDHSVGSNDIGRVVDGNEGTEWQGSATDGTEGDEESRTYSCWFVVDLGIEYDIEAVTIKFEGACAQDYHVDFSANNIDWVVGYNHVGSAGVNGRTDILSSQLTNTANVRYVKFESTKAATQWGMKIFEFHVFGTESASPTKVVSASVNNVAMGTATVKQNNVNVTEVETGSTVTFAATANDGYIFVNWSNGETNATFNATIETAMNLTANFRELGNVYCMTEIVKAKDNVDHTAYVTMKRSDEGEYQLIVRSDEELIDFGGTVFYMPDNTYLVDLRNQGVLSDNNHTLTATFEAEKEPYMGTPLYVVFDNGVGEVIFDQLTNIEYAISCEESLAVTGVTLNRATASVAVGDEFDLTAAITPAFAADKSVMWSSDNTSVATVTSDGHVVAVAVGIARITITTIDGNRTATCDVTVNAELEAQTYWGNGTSMEVAIAYSITRNADHTLTYTIEALHSKEGFSVQVNDGDYHTATKGDDGLYRYTSSDTYEEGSVVSGFFYMPYTGEAARVDFTYTVGDASEREYIPVSLSDDADDASWIEANDGKTLEVDMPREMPADSKFKTICFPFSMSADQVVETFGECEILQLSEARMKSESEMYIRYAPVTSVEAGYPYLITLLGSDKASLLFNGVTINSSTLNNTITVALDDTRSVEMVGTFVNLPRSSDSEFYLDAEDNLLHSIGEYCAESGYPTLTIPAFRCYFRLVGFSNPASVRARVTRAPEVATEVEETLYSAQATKQLRDGQLLIIRNGVSYTVTGLRVE